MRRMRSLTAIAVIGAMVSGMGALPASAYTTYTSIGGTEYRNNDGFIEAVQHHRCNGVLIETDGTVPTEDMFKDVEGYAGLAPWETPVTGPTSWADVSAEPGEHAYMVYFEGGDSSLYETAGRKLMLAYDFVEKASIVEFASYNNTCFWMNHKLLVRAVNEDTLLDESTIPEFAGLSFTGGNGGASYSLDEAGDCQIIRDLEGKSEGEKLEYMLALAQEVELKYNDIIASISPQIIQASSAPDSSELSAASIWDTAGDLDADGEIDASDAAELLALSALKGAGDDSRFTAQQISAADLNGDTFCAANAADYILQFAAEADAGSELSIGEFMTRD